MGMNKPEHPLTEPEFPLVLAERRPMPVVVLADASSSMSGSKMAALNAAVRELAADLGRIDDPRMEVWLSLIRFGGDVQLVMPPAPVTVPPPEFVASGNTPMGQAVDALSGLLQDRSVLPGSAFAPTVVLVSDGHPTPPAAAEAAIARLLEGKTGSRATRLAMAIGDDADHQILRRFIGNDEIPLFLARDVHRIHDFFQWVTFSVQLRSRSRTPNAALVPPTDDLDDDDLFF